MKKPINKSYQRGERKGFIKGFFVAIAMMIILAMCTHSAHAQQYNLNHVSGETELFQDVNGNNVKDLHLDFQHNGCETVVVIQHGNETSEYIISDHESDLFNGTETIYASGLIMHYNWNDSTVMLSFETLDMQGYGEAIYKLKV